MKNIQLSDPVAAALSAQATSQKLSVEAYLETVVLAASSPPARRLPADDLDRLLDAEAVIGPSPDRTFSRAEYYGDHD